MVLGGGGEKRDEQAGVHERIFRTDGSRQNDPCRE